MTFPLIASVAALSIVTGLGCAHTGVPDSQSDSASRITPPDTETGVLLAQSSLTFDDLARFEQSIEKIRRMFLESPEAQDTESFQLLWDSPDLIVFDWDFAATMAGDDAPWMSSGSPSQSGQSFPIRFVVDLSRQESSAAIRARSLYVGEEPLQDNRLATMGRGFAHWVTTELAGYQGR